MEFKPCGECTACCDGKLQGTARGIPFGDGRACAFMCDKKCTIYAARPDTCKKYQCAWTQGLLGEDMRPDKCGLMVSVEVINGEQLLKAIELRPFVPQSSYDTLYAYAEQLRTRVINVRHDYVIATDGELLNA
jgi:Fe-S-cluster containining protein